jgi:two-component system NtrC family sensor kinase
MLVLTVLQGPDKGRRFELPDNEPQMIGRSSESLPLNDATISRRHAELTPDEGRWFIRDLKSSNGTFVNGVRVSDRRMLRPGDQIRTGGTLLEFGDVAAKAVKQPSPIRVVRKGEIDINVERTITSSDDSMIMAVPEPSQAAEVQLRIVYQLISLIGSVMDRQELLEKVMDLIFEHFQADRGFILLTEDDPKEAPRPAVVRHRPIPGIGGGPTRAATPARPGQIEVSRTIVNYVMRRGVGVLSSNAMTDTRFATGDSVQNYGIRSVMCVPIKFKDRLHGLIHLDSQVANYTYTEDQLLLLTAIGVQTGLALNNIHQYEQRLSAERLAAVGQTVASLSHSIKNILQGLRGGADVVELGLRKENMNVTRNGWEIVARNLERIYELTMNMLAYSKQRKPEIEMTNLAPLLTEVCALVQKQYDNKKVALIQDFAQDLPPVPLDPGGVHQAVLNLLNNALDAVEPESGVVTLGCVYDTAGEHVVISVADNGAGMNEATKRKLFEPFHSTKGLRGTGLGLVVTKKIVDEHGGTLRVESEEGYGSTFLLRLPTSLDAVPQSAETHGPF